MGAAGPQGPQGPAGAAGAGAEAGSVLGSDAGGSGSDSGTTFATTGALVWKDSTGAVVPVVRYTGGFNGGEAPFQAIYEVFDPASKAVWGYNENATPGISAGAAFLGYAVAAPAPRTSCSRRQHATRSS
jgi:hypothetical protein